MNKAFLTLLAAPVFLAILGHAQAQSIQIEEQMAVAKRCDWHSNPHDNRDRRNAGTSFRTNSRRIWNSMAKTQSQSHQK
jgi:hypothetical protein